MTYFVNFRQLNDHLFGKELFIRFTASAFRKLPSIYVFSVGDKIWRKSFEVYDTDSPVGEVWQLNFYYGH